MLRREWLLTATCLAGCAKQSGPARSLKVGYLNYPSASVFHVALERGYFTKAGLHVQPETVGTSAESTGLLASGGLDVACGFTGPAFLNAVAKGARIRAVGSREQVATNCGDSCALYARAAAFPSGADDIRSWEGKRIAIGSKAGLGDFLLDSAMRLAGADPTKITPLFLSRNDAAAALVAGSVDAVFNATTAPIRVAGREGILRSGTAIPILAAIQTGHILFGKSMLEAPMEDGVAFLSAYLRALQDFSAGATPKFLEEFRKTAGPGADPNCRDYVVPGGTLDTRTLRLVSEWSVARGYSNTKVDPESVCDLRFLAKAAPQENA